MGNPVSHNSSQKSPDNQADHQGQSRKEPAWRNQPYWIVSATEAIREWEKRVYDVQTEEGHSCKTNYGFSTRKPLRAFSQTSVDFGGAFYTKQGRGKTRQKRYLCLFTCLAVDLERAYSLDTDSFLNAFSRMASRRSPPKDVVCDNGTNFVGGSNELKELEALDQNRIRDATASHRIKWHFQPPLAPHFSGYTRS